jgi:hypothetical protein
LGHVVIAEASGQEICVRVSSQELWVSTGHSFVIWRVVKEDVEKPPPVAQT